MANRKLTSIASIAAAAGDYITGVRSGAVRNFLVSSLANAIDFVASGTGARTRTILDKLRETVTVTDFIQTADAGDIRPALLRAAAVSKYVRFPEGTYTLSAPIDFTNNIVLEGPIWTGNSEEAVVTINAPGGFLKNDNTTRKRIRVARLRIVGPASYTGVIGIDGPFGGRIEDCTFENFDVCIRNASAYLTRYVRNYFYDSNIGIQLADANGCKIEDSQFDARCKVNVDMLSVTPQTGNNNGYPIVIRGNNTNTGTLGGPGQVSFKLRGIVKFVDNYWEDFSSGVSNNECLQLTVNRFDNCAFEISGNEINGQNHALCAVRLIGSTANECRANGIITRNRWLGMVGDDIIYGSVTDPTFNNISYVRIFDNSNPTTIGGMNPLARYAPMATLGFANNPSIAGATYLQLPITNTVLLDNANGTTILANNYRCRKAGLYEISGHIDAMSTASSYPKIDLQLTKAGVEVVSTSQSLNFQSNPTYAQVDLPTVVVDLAVGDDIRLYARGGQTAAKGYLNIVWKGTGDQ